MDIGEDRRDVKKLLHWTLKLKIVLGVWRESWQQDVRSGVESPGLQKLDGTLHFKL